MLSDPSQVPKPARMVIQELAGQQAELEAPNTTPGLTIVPGRFESPFAEWLPEKSKQCEFHVLKPPAGTFLPGSCVVCADAACVRVTQMTVYQTAQCSRSATPTPGTSDSRNLSNSLSVRPRK